MYELMVEETFNAAHALKGYEGPCENLHGHNFRVQAFYRGKELNQVGLMQDFKKLKSDLKAVLSAFDHRHLNEVAPFDRENPSSENLARQIYQLLKKDSRALHKVAVWESPGACAAYREEK